MPTDVIFNVLTVSDKRSSVGGERYPLERHKRHITALYGVLFRLNHNSVSLNRKKCVSGLNIHTYSSGFQRLLRYTRDKQLKNSEKC